MEIAKLVEEKKESSAEYSQRGFDEVGCWQFER